MRIEQETIPDEWNLKTLGDIADVSSGGSAPQGDKYFDGESPFVRVQHIDQDTDSINRYDLITDEAVKKYKLKKYKAGTIVFPKSGASIYLEKRAVLPVDAYIASHLCAVNSAQRDVYQDFLFYSLKHILLSKGKADGYPTLNLSEVKRVAIPVPAFKEQKKVVRILSVIKNTINQQNMIIAKTKELKRSLMHRLFTYGLRGEEQKETDAGIMPINWDVVPLGNICAYTTGKLNSNAAKENGQYPFFTCSQETYRIDNYSFDQEALLLAGNNARAIYSVKYYKGKFDAYQRTYVFTIKDKEKCAYRYLLYELTRKLEMLRISSLGTTTKYITAGIISNLQIALPSLDEQGEIATVLQTIDEKINFETNRKNYLSNLFKTVLQLLMTGKVRVKDVDFGDYL